MKSKNCILEVDKKIKLIETTNNPYSLIFFKPDYYE